MYITNQSIKIRLIMMVVEGGGGGGGGGISDIQF